MWSTHARAVARPHLCATRSTAHVTRHHNKTATFILRSQGIFNKPTTTTTTTRRHISTHTSTPQHEKSTYALNSHSVGSPISTHSNLYKFIIHPRSFASSNTDPSLKATEHPHAPTSAATNKPEPPITSTTATPTTTTTTNVTTAPTKKGRWSFLSRSRASTPLTTSTDGVSTAPPPPAPISISRLLSLTRPEWPILGVGLFSLGIAASITMYVPTAFGKLIDIVTHAKDLQGLNSFAMTLCGLFVIGAAANFGRVMSFQLAGHRVIARLRRLLFGSIVNQDIAFFDKNRTGELINRLSADTVVISKSLTGDNLSSGLRNIAQGIFGISYMIHLSPQLTLCMIGIIPVVFLGGVYGRFVKSLSKQVQDALGKTTDVAEERISNIRTVRAFAQEEREKQVYNHEVDTVFRLARKEALVSAAFFATANLAGSASMLSVLYYGGHLIMQDAITGGMLTSFLMYTVYVGFSVMKMTSFYGDIMKGLGASQRVFELLDQHATIPLTGGVKPASVNGEISFENVAFTYPLRPQAPIFSDLTLRVRQGEVLAVVGASGSGKSTLAALLLRFYDPAGGRVMLDGVDIKTIDPTWLRQNIAIVSQEPVLFSTTILENIRYANQNATLEQVQAAAREANAHDFISAFPDGYNTNVGEKGLNLSGGQKQRVAIARALLTNPIVLILDEATSALDAESEHLVQDALDRLMNGRTVIVIAHRLSTVKKADAIAVLNSGVVVELGSHQELMNRPESAYRHLMKLQHL